MKTSSRGHGGAPAIALCRRLDLLTHAVVAIDGSKFKAVDNRDKNYTVTKVKRRMEQVDEQQTATMVPNCAGLTC
jgi:hypothetical protein